MEENKQVIPYENWPWWVKLISAQQMYHVTTNYLINNLLLVSALQLVMVVFKIDDPIIYVLFANCIIIMILQLKASLWIDRNSDLALKIGWSFKRVLLNIPVAIVLMSPSILYYFLFK